MDRTWDVLETIADAWSRVPHTPINIIILRPDLWPKDMAYNRDNALEILPSLRTMDRQVHTLLLRDANKWGLSQAIFHDFPFDGSNPSNSLRAFINYQE